MKLNRRISNIVAITSLSMIPFLANAHPLSIVNNTKSPISFTVNNKCAEEIGTINEVQVKNITEEVLNKLCSNYTQPCTITAHYGSQCVGDPIGGVMYNTEHDFVVNGDVNTNITITASEDTLIYTSSIKHK